MLLDQFGVLHDGNEAYAGAQHAVKWMADQGMKLLILSNSSKSQSNLCSKHRSQAPVVISLELRCSHVQGPLMPCSAFRN